MADAGEVIADRYRLVQQIGRGGFGTVWAAEQLGLDRRVAIKLLIARGLDRSAYDRFVREAKLAQNLQHPNTVRLLDFGLYHSEIPFIVFELLEGQSLSALLKREGALSPQRVLRISMQVLKSLMEAHQRGIVHRDIKPANIFITAHAGEPDYVKVLDFGIAKSLDANGQPLTATGDVVGTPAYMAPEHLSSNAATPSSDLYSLGLVIAEMLSGRRVVAGGMFEACQQQLSEESIALPPEVMHSGFGAVIAKAIEKHPAHRYQSAAAMLADLERAAPTSIVPPAARVPGGVLPLPPTLSATLDDVVRGGSRSPRRSGLGAAVGVALGAALLVVVLLGVGIGALLWSRSRAQTGALAPASDSPVPSAPAPASVSMSAAPAPAPPEPEPGSGDASVAKGERFEPVAFVTRAQALARAKLPDAGLIEVILNGPEVDGTIVLDGPKKSAAYRFRSPKRSEGKLPQNCIVQVEKSMRGVRTELLVDDRCDDDIIAAPHCALKELQDPTATPPRLEAGTWVTVGVGNIPGWNLVLEGGDVIRVYEERQDCPAKWP